MSDKIFFQEDGKVREATAEEIAQLAIDLETQRTEQEARITARESALAKLAALGLTEEEIAAL